MSIPIGFSIRVGVVKKVGRTYVDFEFLDRLDQQTFRAPIPHPYAGRGGGIFIGIEKDTIILVSNGIGEKWYILATIPDHNFFFALDGAKNIKYYETQFPNIREGEIILKGNTGQTIELINNGNIRIDAGLGNKSSDIELSKLAKAIINRTDQIYTFTEAGRSIDGLIRRDLGNKEDPIDTKTLNFMDGELYEKLLSYVGRSPKNEVHNSTAKIVKQTARNPALVEKRYLVYEFANSFNVRDFESEVNLLNPSKEEIPENLLSDRRNRRSDVLDLNLRNYNHLIEKVEGTLVDIYGNVLDINRNIIPIPNLSDLRLDKESLRYINDHLRRSVKLHYEINTRKPISGVEPPETDLDKDNAKNFSKWSFDVDSEGFTKVNIPATSDTGNIPVLTRYLNSSDPNDKNSGSFKDEKRKDIRVKQFGIKDGQKIEDSSYKPDTIDGSAITINCAHHNIFDIAKSIFDNGKLKSPTLGTDKVGPVSESINNKIPGIDETSADPRNAGGRSLHLNLDGSLELNVGADNVDKKSIVIDTAGGILAHYGRDKNGRSIISQTDGDIIIQVGGTGTGDDTKNRAGRVEIHLNRSNDSPQKIIIDENGMTLDINGNMLFKSTGDFVLSAGGKLLMSAEQIFEYGTFDEDKRSAKDTEIRVRRKGRST